jgi:hypothetical protein
VKNIGWRRSVMHAVIRSYSGKGTKALFDLFRGGFSVSVYEDKAGADESSRVAREWIAKNASKIGVARPTILEGTVIVQLK